MALVAIYALPVVVLVYRLDLYEREPPSLLASRRSPGARSRRRRSPIRRGWNEVARARPADRTFAAVGSIRR